MLSRDERLRAIRMALPLAGRSVLSRIYDALEAAGAFTPDQPADPWAKHRIAGLVPDQTAAPDEDAEIAELARIMHHGVGAGNTFTTCQTCIQCAKNAWEAGYRRPVDTRPTRSELMDDLIDFYRPDLIINRLIRRGRAVEDPDPAPAAEVPVVEVRHDDLSALITAYRMGGTLRDVTIAERIQNAVDAIAAKGDN